MRRKRPQAPKGVRAISPCELCSYAARAAIAATPTCIPPSRRVSGFYMKLPLELGLRYTSHCASAFSKEFEAGSWLWRKGAEKRKGGVLAAWAQKLAASTGKQAEADLDARCYCFVGACDRAWGSQE